MDTEIGHPLRLFCVVGCSPAVVTETLWALCIEEGHAVIAIHVVTTQKGYETLAPILPSLVEEMKREYTEAASRLPREEDIHVECILDAQGEPLDDIDDERSSAALADLLTSRLRDYTAPDQPRLHASLAGGRKTMSHYMGSAMTLFARPVDEMSHVLVDPVATQCRDFYYPTAASKMLRAHNGDEVDASTVTVRLHRPPLLRLRAVLESASSAFSLPETYEELIDYAQRALGPVRVRLDAATNTIRVGSSNLTTSPTRAAILGALLMAKSVGIERLDAAEFLFSDTALGPLLVDLYTRRDEQKRETFFQSRSEDWDDIAAVAEQNLDTLRKNVSYLKTDLNKQFDGFVARQLVPSNVGERGAPAYAVEIGSEHVEVVGLDDTQREALQRLKTLKGE